MVIVLGMLADDAVVGRGHLSPLAPWRQTDGGLQGHAGDKVAPATGSRTDHDGRVRPLILLPGILGDFMRVVPTVWSSSRWHCRCSGHSGCCWHTIAAGVNLPDRPGRVQRLRERFTHGLQISYMCACWSMRRCAIAG